MINELLSGDSLAVKEFATIIANARVELTGTFTLERGTECTINKGVKQISLQQMAIYQRSGSMITANLDHLNQITVG